MDAQKAMRELSKPHGDGEKIPEIISRCARLTGFCYSRCFEIYYGRSRRIDAAELARIEEALARKNRLDARNELSDLRLRLMRLETRLLQTDEEFHRETIGLVGAQARGGR